MREWLLEKKFYMIGILFMAAFLMYLMQKEPQEETAFDNNIVQAVEEREGDTEAIEEEKNDIIMVDVKGEVKKPGVYIAGKNERVKDMIEKAGGLSGKADSSRINFAQKLADEMVIIVPALGEPATSGAAASPIPQDEGKININNADAEKLQEIPGIGPAKAAAIIDYREKNGPFKKTAELKEISGIGEKTFEKLEGFITVH